MPNHWSPHSSWAAVANIGSLDHQPHSLSRQMVAMSSLTAAVAALDTTSRSEFCIRFKCSR